ncbi:DUF2628 domain-containing protein [Maritalea myrionectae]|uniref:DUF2628 domain-containing protein n=1 Tax=Maritalea myrionectae TaxID=454601 RepID=A0A2R4M9V3_9HYPH|nr:DUF2628 domain-containing protein [Maritalea myrionectae]AVX02821.1 hypothetical protein MXMO3_00273 [Maritalea myrionectae]
MRLYSIYEKMIDDEQELVVVPDKFSWFAALLTPVWCIVHLMWLELLAYVGVAFILGFVTFFVGEDASWWIGILVAILIGLEAGSIRGRFLERKGYVLKAIVPSSSSDDAAYRYTATRVFAQRQEPKQRPAAPMSPFAETQNL